MRRMLALVAAAAMVAAAVVIRARLDDDGNGGGGPLRLVCSQELEQACRSVESRVRLMIEPAGTTADRLAAATGDDVGLDGWIVPDPWPEIVDGRRRARALPTLFENRQRLARSPLVLAVWKERGAALSSSRCNGPVSWKCLGDAAAAGPWTESGGRPEWGLLKPGHGSPTQDGVSLLVLGQAVSNWFGRTDLSTIDLDDDAFARWFTALERAVSPDRTVVTMLTVGPAGADAVGTIEAEARPVLDRSARRAEVDLLYPSPMATADVVLATAGSGSAASSMRRVAGGNGDVRRALLDNGWQAPDAAGLRPGSDLPPPGLLDALRSRYREVTGR